MPSIEKTLNGTRLVANIDFPDVDLTPEIEFSRSGYPRGRRQLWFEVENEYAQYLTAEVGDAFVVALIQPAMRLHCDLMSEAPVSEDLLYKLQTYYCPAIASNSEDMISPLIDAPIFCGSIKSAQAVGTGISCGIDSFEVIATHYKSKFTSYNLTHLCLFFAGAYDQDDVELDREEFRRDEKRALEVCNKLGLKFLKVISNISDPELFRGYHLQLVTPRNVSCVLALRKLFSVYLFASCADLSKFDINKKDRYDCEDYDYLTVNSMSVKGLSFHSAGCAKTRYEKTKTVAEFEPARHFLHVCLSETGGNCNRCKKCLRTLTTLDALGELDRFSEIFDIGYYRKHRSKYLKWLYLQVKLGAQGDAHVGEVFQVLKRDIPFSVKVQVTILAFFIDIWNGLKGIRVRLSRMTALRNAYGWIKRGMVHKMCGGGGGLKVRLCLAEQGNESLEI